MLGWDPGKVSNIEHGKVRASEIDIVQFLGRCGRSQEFITDFLTRYRSAFDLYFVQAPDKLRTLSMAESSAESLFTYNLAHLPGLSQSKEYTQAVYEDRAVLPPDKIEAAVRFRSERTTLLRRHDRPLCTFFIHENALRLNVGGPEVMEDQLMRLLFNTHSIRVVRAASGAAGVYLAEYVLWNFEKRSTVAYAESEIAQVFVQDPSGVKDCKKIFERLDSIALSEEQSRAMVADLASRAREDHGRQLSLT
ncbi:transcriptional regulator [Lentzea pudingi]|uniref:Transcriptional regulator n=2 Tax=Lentzea pudingi TaxID=1789439 RepID=A0ABQ2HJM7_9PSEU|nr:transcriptional regulator [Lentzea pudingi]